MDPIAITLFVISSLMICITLLVLPSIVAFRLKRRRRWFVLIFNILTITSTFTLLASIDGPPNTGVSALLGLVWLLMQVPALVWALWPE